MYSCIDCGYLDKSRKNYSDKGNQDYFQYGCNQRGPDKFICGWCNSDSDLKRSYLGCSNWIEKSKPCPHDSSHVCNFKNAYKVKLSLGETCDKKCCWGCDEICGVKCNPSAHGTREIISKVESRIMFYSDNNQLPGQMNIMDFL